MFNPDGDEQLEGRGRVTFISITDARRELTFRAVAIGVAITLVLTAAQVYLGLKLGLTFATSIPAAVISMAVLRAMPGATIWENNIVQTVASAAGTLSSVIFVLPGLVMVGWWTGFPFWQSFGVCVIGGILGVMFSIPLRRALVVNSNLPFPEGVAAAEVIRLGGGNDGDLGGKNTEENKSGLMMLAAGAIASATFAFLTQIKMFASTVAFYFRPTPNSATGVGASMSLALFGAGQLMGPAVGLAMLVGMLVGWGVAIPMLVATHPAFGSTAAVVQAMWSTKVRFIGAGAIASAAVWTLGRMALPVWSGITAAVKAAIAASMGEYEELPRVERDLPIWIVLSTCIIAVMPMTGLLQSFTHHTALSGIGQELVVGSVVYVLIGGFLVASICGYMAGLIGANNSPISGVAIISLAGAASLVMMISKYGHHTDFHALVAFALFLTSILVTVATIANDNLQDLKTGHLIDATPWKQQVGLIIGVVAGSLIIPPVLGLLNHAFGLGADAHSLSGQHLAAPQATLISALANGIIGGQLDWGLIEIGGTIGLALVALDEVLRRTTRFSLPPLGVSIAIYLPNVITTPIVIGALFGWGFNKVSARWRDAGKLRRMGTLLASGMIVGESLFNLVVAGLVVCTGKGEPLQIFSDSFVGASTALGVVGLCAFVGCLFILCSRAARHDVASPINA